MSQRDDDGMVWVVGTDARPGREMRLRQVVCDCGPEEAGRDEREAVCVFTSERQAQEHVRMRSLRDKVIGLHVLELVAILLHPRNRGEGHCWVIDPDSDEPAVLDTDGFLHHLGRRMQAVAGAVAADPLGFLLRPPTEGERRMARWPFGATRP
jgi:hypothetical protein